MNPVEYEILYRVETEHWWYRNLHALLDRALERYLPTAAGPVLDAGCGTGAVAARLSARYATMGLDFSPIALEFTRSRAALPVVRGSIAALPFTDNTFAAVVSLDVVSHAGAGPPAQSLAELARVIAPGGHLFLNLPAYRWLHSPHDVQVQTGFRFTRPQLTHLIENSGLLLEHCTYWNTLLMPVIVAARLAKQMAKSTSSDVAGYQPGLGAAICSTALALERSMLRRATLPFGVSLFAVATKPR